jgi:hypothetical protein
LCLFADEFPSGLDLAATVAQWTMVNLLDHDGYFYYRKYPFVISRTPYFHWGQATMFKALAHLLWVTAARGERRTVDHQVDGLECDDASMTSKTEFYPATAH